MIHIYGKYVFSVYIRDHIFICEFDFIKSCWRISEFFTDFDIHIIDFCINRISCVQFLRYVYDNNYVPF